MNTCTVESCPNDIAVKKHSLCRSHYNKFHYYGKLPKDDGPTECKRCGKPTPGKAGAGPRPAYCTKDCQREARREYQRQYQRTQREATRNTRAPRDCTWCAEPLPQGTPGQTRYHTQCAKAHKATQPKDNHARQCVERDCDRPVRARDMCTMHWKRWARAQGLVKPEPWNDRRRDNYHRRRARMHGSANGDKVLLSDLVVRDNSTCQLCHEHIDLTLSWPHPRSKSIDHIMPLSKGGEHSLTNAQLACLQCNVRKSDKTMGELMRHG